MAVQMISIEQDKEYTFYFDKNKQKGHKFKAQGAGLVLYPAFMVWCYPVRRW